MVYVQLQLISFLWFWKNPNKLLIQRQYTLRGREFQLASLYKKFLGQIKHWSHDLWEKWILSKLQKHEKLHQQSHSGDKESNFLGTGVLKIA